jgi:hypothetical protein
MKHYNLYVYTNQDGDKFGIDIPSWSDADLNGNAPFIYRLNGVTPPAGYVDISSIVNWDRFQVDEVIAHSQIVKISKEIGFSNLTLEEQQIVNEWGPLLLISQYVSPEQNPFFPDTIDYDIIGLYKRRVFVKGELLMVEYYGEYDIMTSTYSERIIREIRTYQRFNGYLALRVMDIQWFDSDGAICDTKQTIKYYSAIESIQAGSRRRENLIEEVKIVTVGLIQMTEALTLPEAETIGKVILTILSDNIQLYVKGEEAPLLNQIMTMQDVEELDNIIPGTNQGSSPGIKIREYMYSELIIDYSKTYTLEDMSPFSP